MLGPQLRKKLAGVDHITVLDVAEASFDPLFDLRAFLGVQARPRVVHLHDLQLHNRALRQIGGLVDHEVAVSDLRGTLPEDRAVLYSDLIEAALSEAARTAFFMLPQGYEFQSKTARDSFQKGTAEGHAAAVVTVLEARGLTVTDEQRERITATTDLELLKVWLRRAVTVASADELFA